MTSGKEKLNNKRIVEFDIVRIFCIIWIVAYWHMPAYANIEHFEGAKFITAITMSCFFFISGRVLHNKKIRTFSDIKRFAKTRFWGFEVPFIISALTLIPFSWYSGSSQILLTITGFSAVSGTEMVSTLWFASMLLLFYYCFIICSVIKIKHNWIIWAVLFVLLVVEYSFLGFFDYRILRYFTVFAAGSIMPEKIYTYLTTNKIGVLGSGIITVCGYFFSEKSYYLGIIMYFFGVLFCIGLAKFISNNKYVFRTAGILVKGCSFAYFFHRQFFIVAFKLLSPVSKFNPFFSIFVLFTIFYAICIWCQIGYTKITKHMMGFKMRVTGDRADG